MMVQSYRDNPSDFPVSPPPPPKHAEVKLAALIGSVLGSAGIVAVGALAFMGVITVIPAAIGTIAIVAAVALAVLITWLATKDNVPPPLLASSQNNEYQGFRPWEELATGLNNGLDLNDANSQEDLVNRTAVGFDELSDTWGIEGESDGEEVDLF